MYRGKRIAAVVLARAGSNRLAGKMTLPFAGHATVVEAAIARVRQSRVIDDIVFAVPDSRDDDVFIAVAERAGIELVRGSEDDVVSRMRKAVSSLDAQPAAVVRVCSDNPVLMPTLIDQAVAQLIEGSFDVLTPFEFNSYPFGLSQVVMTADCLARIDKEATDPVYREHVENFCFDNPKAFAVGYQEAPPDLAWPELCLTLDYASDYERLKMYAEALAGVELEDQPRAAIKTVRAARVAVIGFDVDGLSGLTDTPSTTMDAIENLRRRNFDLIVSAFALDGRPDITAPRGVVWADTAKGRLLCRLDDETPFIVHEAEARPGETAASYMARELPGAIRHLLAGPPRPLGRRHKSGEKMIRGTATRPAGI